TNHAILASSLLLAHIRPKPETSPNRATISRATFRRLRSDGGIRRVIPGSSQVRLCKHYSYHVHAAPARESSIGDMRHSAAQSARITPNDRGQTTKYASTECQLLGVHQSSLMTDMGSGAALPTATSFLLGPFRPEENIHGYFSV